MGGDASDIGVRLTLDGGQTFSMAIARAERQVQHFGHQSVRSGRHGVQAWMASSAALRVLEGNMTNNIRAAERFIASNKRLSAFLVKAFPLVGAVALLGVMSKLGKSVYDFIEKSKQMPNVLAAGFSSITDSLEQANDQLSVVNEKLQISIDKLERRPVNGIALALDEARVSADRLWGSLEKDRIKMAELMDKNRSSIFSQVFLNRGRSTNVEGTINSYTSKFSNLEHQRNEALHAGDTQKADYLKGQLYSTYTSAWNKMASDIAMRRGTIQERDQAGFLKAVPYAVEHGNQDQNVQTETSFQTYVQERMDQQDMQDRNATLTQQKLNIQKKAGHGKSLLAAQRAADAAQMKQFELEHSQWEAASTRSAEDEVHFWTTKMRALKVGSTNYRIVYSKALAGLENERKQAAALQKRVAKSMLHQWDASATVKPDKSVLAWMTTVNKGADIASANAHQFEDVNLAIERQTGNISRLSAAQQRAALDTQRYTDDLQALQHALDEVNADPSLTIMQRKQLTQQITNQKSILAGQYGVANMQNQAAIQSAKPFGALHDSTMRLAQQFTDLGSAMTSVTQTALGNFNSSLTGMVAGHRFIGPQGGAQYALNAASRFSSTTLQYGEGLVAKHLMSHGSGAKGGLGGILAKHLMPHHGSGPTGTMTDPWFVSLVNNPTLSNNGPLGSAQHALNKVAPGLGNVAPGVSGSTTGGMSIPGSSAGGTLATAHGALSRVAAGSSVASAALAKIPSLSPQGTTATAIGQLSGLTTTGISAPAGGSSTSKNVMTAVGVGLKMLPLFGFASGGPVAGNVPIVVGERGREIFTPGAAGGYITPNHAIAGGGASHTTYNIDARNSTNPALTAAHVQAALHHTQSRAVHQSLHATHDMKRRLPVGA